MLVTFRSQALLLRTLTRTVNNENTTTISLLANGGSSTSSSICSCHASAGFVISRRNSNISEMKLPWFCVTVNRVGINEASRHFRQSGSFH